MAQLTFDLDGLKFQAKAALVRPHFPWVDDPATGRRKPSQQQGFGEGGRPLWEVDCLVRNRDSDGRASVDKVMVLVEAASLPPIPEDDEVPVVFDDLRVRVYNASAGGLGKAFMAQGMRLLEGSPHASSRSRQTSEAAA